MIYQKLFKVVLSAEEEEKQRASQLQIINTEKSKPTHTHEKSNQRTHREIKTQNINHNPKVQKSNSTNKSTKPRFMRRKEIEH